MGTATAAVTTTLLVIEKKEMSRVLHEEHALADIFISHVLSRNWSVPLVSSPRVMLSSQRLWPISCSFWVAFMIFLQDGMGSDGLADCDSCDQKIRVFQFHLSAESFVVGLCQPPSEVMILSASFGPQLPGL